MGSLGREPVLNAVSGIHLRVTRRMEGTDLTANTHVMFIYSNGLGAGK